MNYIERIGFMPKNKLFTTFVAAVFVASASVLASPAMAQQAPSEVSESEREAFIVAYKDVVAIEQDYIQQIQTAEDEATQQAILDEARAEMTQAVEAAPDISVDRYIEILRLAQSDPDLQADLTSRLQD
jgi:hypothetical protein